MTALPPGATIGILGGGQLGRMLAVAAARLGLRTHVFEPGADPPAAGLAHRTTRAGYDDAAALADFAGSVDVVTYEFENIPTAALDAIEALRPIRPNRRALAIAQDRLSEKEFLAGLGLATAPYADVPDAAALAAALDRIGAPAILKTRRLGYDGKGQARIADPSAAAAALAGMAGMAFSRRLRAASACCLARSCSRFSLRASRSSDGSFSDFLPKERRCIAWSLVLSASTSPSR
jgi:5-(carboxyamino)imidazole ribonucleotide synthase